MMNFEEKTPLNWQGQFLSMFIQAVVTDLEEIPEIINIRDSSIIVNVEGKKPRCDFCKDTHHDKHLSHLHILSFFG